jgi:hypothetical protein
LGFESLRPSQATLEALDQEFSASCDLHCLGGFVLTEHYGVARRRHRAYVDVVTVAEIPDDYESQLIDMQVGGLTHLRLLAFEGHDLVLAKLARNTDRDREDVVALARAQGLTLKCSGPATGIGYGRRWAVRSART